MSNAGVLGPLYRAACLIISLAAHLVPRQMRRDWIDEWRGELWHSLMDHSEQSWATRLQIASRSLGSFTDALACRSLTPDAGALSWRLWAITPSALDFIQGARSLRRSPRFSAPAVAMLTCAIGVNIAVFGLVDALHLRPLPFEQSDRLVQLKETFSHADGNGSGTVSAPNLADWRQRNQTFAALAAYRWASFNLTGPAIPERVRGYNVELGLFRLLGVTPKTGRIFDPNSDRVEDRLVLLSARFARQQFDQDPSPIGESLEINGERFTVVGVMPPSFDFPIRSRAAFWVPMDIDAAHANRGSHDLPVVGRLRPTVSFREAEEDMARIAHDLAREYPAFQQGRGVRLIPLDDAVEMDTRARLLSAWAAASLIFLLACANVAGMGLVRAKTCRHTLALQAVMRTRRASRLRHALAEGLLLALFSGVVGLVLGVMGLTWLSHQRSVPLDIGFDAGIDARLLVCWLTLVLITAGFAGLLPALRSGHAHRTPENESRGHHTAWHRVLAPLVLIQTALAVVAVIGAILMLESLWNLKQVDPGLTPDHVLTLRVTLPEARYDTPQAVRSFFDDLLNGVAALPEVREAGLISHMPTQAWGRNGNFSIVGMPAVSLRRRPFAELRVASAGYFRTMGIPVHHGRPFLHSDQADTPRVAVINEDLAARYWPDGGAIGARLTFENPSRLDRQITVVGIVGNIKTTGLRGTPEPELYVPASQGPRRSMNVVALGLQAPESLIPKVQQLVSAMDPDQPIYRVHAMNQVLASTLLPWREQAILASFFALFALTLCHASVRTAVSLTGHHARSTWRSRYAPSMDRIQRLAPVGGRNVLVPLIGVATGVGLALAARPFLTEHLFQVRADDPITFVVATLGVFLMITISARLPRRPSAAPNIPILPRSGADRSRDG